VARAHPIHQILIVIRSLVYSTRLGDNMGDPQLSPAARNTDKKNYMVNRPRELTGELAIADDDIARFEFGRSRGHQTGNLGWKEQGISYSLDDAEAYWELVERGDVATELFLSDPTARTATLGILRLRGDWDAGARLQDKVVGPDSPLRAEPFYGIEIANNDPEAEQFFTIDWGIVSVGGLAMVTKRRLIMQTLPIEEEVDTPQGKYLATTSIEVDKRAAFALDIEKLAVISPEAAHEARLIIICGMIASRDLAKLSRAVAGTPLPSDFAEIKKRPINAELANLLHARHKMQQYGITADEVMERAFGDTPELVRGASTLEAIKSETEAPTGLLIPSTINFYGARTLHHFEQAL
jgi:hypothetical protein